VLEFAAYNVGSIEGLLNFDECRGVFEFFLLVIRPKGLLDGADF
jgi:hypothetical protein